MVFLDDSKFEQEEVKRNLPDVEVLNVSNVNDFIPAIEDSGLFFLDKETKEDKKKTLQYKIIQKAQNLKLKVKSQDEYLKKLKMILYISRLNQNNFDRSLQLINKVNQFNLTNIRFDNRELTNFLKKKENIGFIARLKDKFGDNGLTALVMGKSITNKKYEIINFLLSCRILGRNVEKSLLSFFLNYLKKQGVSEVEGKFNKTKKNIQCKDFYILNGFTKIGNKYSITLNRQILKNNTQHIIIKNEKN
jgi:FkbH-like protein